MRLDDEKMWEVMKGVWIEMLCFSAGKVTCTPKALALVGVPHLCLASDVTCRNGDICREAAESASSSQEREESENCKAKNSQKGGK